MNRKTYNDAQPGMAHVALQAMALTMGGYDYDTIRDIYMQYDLRLTPIESNGKRWREAGWTDGELKRYSWGDGMQVSAKAWADIMRTIRPEQVERLMTLPVKRGTSVSSNVRQFVAAFLAFVHGQPFEEKVKRLVWPVIMKSDPKVLEIVFQMAHQPENAAFLKYVNPQILTLVYHSEYSEKWENMEPAGDENLLREVFWENEQLEEVRRRMFRDCYLYNVEFLKTGKLQEVLQQMSPDGGYYKMLSAIKTLHDGKPLEAYQQLSQILKAVDGDTFNEPLSNFAYAVAIGLSGDAKARKTAEKLMKSRKAKDDSTCYAMLVALHHFIQGDAAAFYDKNPILKCKSQMSWRLTALFLKHYQIFDKDLPMTGTAEDWVVANGFDYLRLLYSDDFKKLHPIAKKLREQTGLATNLLPTVKKKKRWELIIDQLMKMNVPKGAAPRQAQVEMERVAYLVNTYRYDVQPKLQKSKDGGVTWSRGRNIALKSFKTGGEKCMTPQDLQVASHVKMYEYGWYGSVSYELGGPAVIAALVGCPSVFSAQTDEHLDIVEEPLQLTVQPHAGGFTVKANVDISDLEGGISIQQAGGKQLTVTTVSSTQKKTLELLEEIKVLPRESKKQLTDLLQRLSGEMTVMSPLLKNATELKHIEANAPHRL